MISRPCTFSINLQLALEDLIVLLKTSLQESEQRQAERVSETEKQFTENVGVQECKLADLETAIENSSASMSTAVCTCAISSAASVSRVDGLEKTLENMVARIKYGSAVLIFSQAAPIIARVHDLSRQ